MKFYSTNKKSEPVDFREATIQGQAPDKGLYFPEAIPQLDKEFIRKLENLTNEEIAFRVIKPYVNDVIPDEKLFQIVSETINFPIPLVQVNENIFSLELFHGPTLAFKDVGARFMSRCLSYFLKDNTKSVTVLVATSGDTGGAVANGFYETEGVEVVILYPSGKVSPVQEKQLTTLGKNIHAFEVKGTFDDCQLMVKKAFADETINKKRFLTSANSINVARWLPQQFYYFFAYKQWLSSSSVDRSNPPVVSVPSGNFGNICAGILAQQSGLPIQHFIAACNVNDIVSDYLQTEILKPKNAIPTISNAMDVGNPSNFIRILEIFQHRFPELKAGLSSFSISDEETLTTIKEVYKKYNYLLDPHGAVGYLSLQRYLANHTGQRACLPNRQGIFLETAHPVKFPQAVETATGQTVQLPSSLANLMNEEKQSFLIENDFEQLKQYLLQ